MLSQKESKRDPPYSSFFIQKSGRSLAFPAFEGTLECLLDWSN
jgi:hypothetical protein